MRTREAPLPPFIGRALKMLTVHETAKILGVHNDTVRRYVKVGKLKGMRDHNNWRRFDHEDVMRLKDELERLVPDNA